MLSHGAHSYSDSVIHVASGMDVHVIILLVVKDEQVFSMVKLYKSPDDIESYFPQIPEINADKKI